MIIILLLAKGLKNYQTSKAKSELQTPKLKEMRLKVTVERYPFISTHISVMPMSSIGFQCLVSFNGRASDVIKWSEVLAGLHWPGLT